MKKIALIAMSLVVLTSPVFAEDAKTTGTAPAEAKFSTVSKDEMFSSKLKGLNVYNQKDETIGEIADIALKNHQVDALILSVGGFLGMGEHYVAVSPSSVSIRHDAKNDKWLASMNTTKEALKAAPEFNIRSRLRCVQLSKNGRRQWCRRLLFQAALLCWECREEASDVRPDFRNCGCAVCV